MSLTQDVREALADMYPTRVLPRGAAVSIARETGATAGSVSRVMAREGYRVSRPTLTTKRPRCKVCMYCGEKAVWGSLCHAHYYVPVSCFGCERIFYLTPSKAIERLGRKFKSGPFCSRQCQGQWLGNQYGFGRES